MHFNRLLESEPLDRLLRAALMDLVSALLCLHTGDSLLKKLRKGVNTQFTQKCNNYLLCLTIKGWRFTTGSYLYYCCVSLLLLCSFCGLLDAQVYEPTNEEPLSLGKIFSHVGRHERCIFHDNLIVSARTSYPFLPV